MESIKSGIVMTPIIIQLMTGGQLGVGMARTRGSCPLPPRWSRPCRGVSPGAGRESMVGKICERGV